MSYIDTQGISLPNSRPVDNTIEYPPMITVERTIFNDIERKELKQMFREVLDEYVRA